MPDVSVLASALKNNPDLIYQYVHDHIRYVPVYGYQRGPVGTILDGEGSDLDQAVLMQQLLISAGYTSNLIIGQISLTGAQLASWLGTDGTVATAQTLLTNGGIPTTTSGSSLIVNHAWVQVTISGTNYVFDPSYKPSTFTASINIPSALGSYQGVPYSAGAIGGGSSVTSATVRAQLQGYATNLENYIKTNYPNGAKLETVIGGQTITPLPLPLVPLRQTSLAYQTGTTTVESIPPVAQWVEVTLTMPGVAAGGRSDLWYSSNLTTSAGGYQIDTPRETYIDYTGQYPVFYESGPNSNVFTSTATGTVAVTISVTYPYLSSTQTQTQTVNIVPGGKYELVSAWGHVGRGQIERMRKAASMQSGHYSLPLQAQSWLAQSMLATQIKDQLSGTETVFNAVIGIYGLVPGSSGNSQPYFDVPIIAAATSSLTASSGWTANASLLDTFGIFHAGSRSTIQQTRAVDAVSFMSVADGGSGLQQVTSLPSGTYYTTSDQTMVANFATSGGRVFLAPYVTLANGWSGYGFALVGQNSSITYYLSGDIRGAQAAAPITTTTFDSAAQSSAMDPKANGGAGAKGIGVDPTTGDITYNQTLVSAGTGFPLAAKVGYNSGAVLRSSPLFGPGWASNWEISATYGDDPFHAMGHEATALDASAAIAGLYISQDLLNQDQTLTSGGTVSATGNDFIAASYVQSWLSDQLKNNTVTITSFGAMAQFGLLPDGTYNAPPGTQLTASGNGTLAFKDKSGTVTQFEQITTGFGTGNEQVVATITDRVGNATNFTYQSSTSPVLASVTDAAGHAATISGSQIAISGLSASYSTTSGVGVGSLTDPQGNNYTVTYNSCYGYCALPPANLIRLTGAYRPDGTQIFYINFDNLDRANLSTSGDTNRTRYYTTPGRIEVDDPVGNASVSYYDDYGRATTSVDPLGNTATISYDALNRVLTKALPEGNSAAYQYDVNGNVIQTTATPKPGSGLSAVTVGATYNMTWNLPATKTDANGNITTYSYNASNGNLLSVTSPTVSVQGGGQQTLVAQCTSYNNRGQLLSMTGPDGMITNYTYASTTGDPLTKVVDAGSSPHLNITTSKTYDSYGNPATSTDANGNTTTYTYSSSRQLTGATLATGASSSITYTVNGQTGALYPADGTTVTMGYDQDGNPSGKSVNGVNNFDMFSQTWAYDTDERVSGTTAQGITTSVSYDADSHVSTVTNSASNVAVQYAYNPNGTVQSKKDANGNLYSYIYDGLDRLIQTTWPDGSYTAETYDAASNVLTFRNRNGDVTGFAYDQLNRKVTLTPPSGSGDSAKSFTYDMGGRKLTASDTNGTFTYGYDTAGRMISVQRPDGKTIQYAYDQNGNRTKLTWPDGFYVNYTYDVLNRMTGITNSTWCCIQYSYSSTNQRLANETYTTSTSPSIATTFALDNGMNLTGINNPTTSSFPSYAYTMSGQTGSFGKRGSMSVTGGTGNPYFWTPLVDSSTTYNINTLNQYSSVVSAATGTANLTYDTKGNLANDGTNTYSWDYRNRLTGATNSLHTATYTYDLFGRRASKTVDGVQTVYLDDGIKEIAEYSASGTVLRYYVYGLGGQLVAMIAAPAGSGNVLYHMQDGLGSVVATMTYAGTVQDQRAYGPYGEGIPSSGTPFGFAGMRYDSETGLYYDHARYYHPTLGRFLSPDPRHEKKDGSTGGDGQAGSASAKGGPDVHDGDSTYAYAGNDPINNVDPNGACGTAVDSITGDGFAPNYSNPGPCELGGDGLDPDFVVVSWAPWMLRAALGPFQNLSFGQLNGTVKVTAADLWRSYLALSPMERALYGQAGIGLAENALLEEQPKVYAGFAAAGTLGIAAPLVAAAIFDLSGPGTAVATWADTTAPGALVTNVTTDVTAPEAAATLQANGFRIVSTSGPSSTFVDDTGAQYVLRPSSSASGGWALDYTSSGGTGVALKVNLGP